MDFLRDHQLKRHQKGVVEVEGEGAIETAAGVNVFF